MKKYIPTSVLAVVLVVIAGILSFVVLPEEKDMITGKVTTQVYIYETSPEGCSVNLTVGINHVSFFCVTGERSINQSLVDRTNTSLNYTAIFKYNANNPNDAWDSYNPSLPDWAVQSLTRLDRRNGYVIQMNEDGEFFRDGYRFSNTDIVLYQGWNFIGYPSDNERNITQALSQINGRYTRTETYTPVDGTKTWLLYIPGTGGTLEFMKPMEGYWIYMNQSATLYVDW